jgi:hypothetical protein
MSNRCTTQIVSRGAFRRSLTAAVGLMLAWASAFGFGIAPMPEDLQAGNNAWAHLLKAITNAEGHVVDGFEKRFATPVHEEITRLGYTCDPAANDCTKIDDGKAPDSVLQGVQWNDNPPFKLRPWQLNIAPMCAGLLIQLPNSWPGCWGLVFGSAETAAAPPDDHVTFGPDAPILQRSHFGDMQFLHAMAPDDEPANVTHDKVMAWAHFAWDVSSQHVAPTVVVSTPAAGSGAQFFPAEYYGMDVSSLFTLGTVPHSKERVEAMALGSLLHMIEDSFARGHVNRESPNAPGGHWPGRIVEFHSYAHQDHALHAAADDRSAFEKQETKGLVIEAVNRVLALKGKDWSAVEPVLSQVFDVVEFPNAAGPGDDYRVAPNAGIQAQPGPALIQ